MPPVNKHLLWVLLALPTIIIIVLALSRKHAPDAAPKHVHKISGQAINTAQSVFLNREFIGITEQTQIENSLSNLIARLPLNENCRIQATKSCWGVIKAYGTGDWDLFEAVRVPKPGYVTSPDILGQMRGLLPAQSQNNSAALETNPIALYKAIWVRTFSNQPLYNEISLRSNTVDLLNVSKEEVGGITFSRLNAHAGQIFAESCPATVFDYNRYIFPNSGTTLVLRLSYFGKLNEHVSPLMIAFAWDGAQSVWIPFRLCEGFARQPLSRIWCF